MPSLPWHKWYPSKWLSSETRLAMTLAERSIYRDLLDCNYEKGSLPNDQHMLAQLAGASQQEFDHAWPKVSKNFTPCGGDPTRLTNLVVEDELRRRSEKVIAGKSGGRPRRKPDGLQTENKSEIETETETEKRAKKNTHSLTQVLSARERELLNEFLELYPKKTHQEKARRVYKSVIDSESGHAELMDGLHRWIESEQWFKSLMHDGGRFIPDPDKFLVDLLWQDHPPVKPASMSAAIAVIDAARRKRKPEGSK